MTMQRTTPASLAVLAAVAGGLLVVLAVLVAPVRAASHAIDVRDGAFRPTELTVRAGDTVTWTNNGDAIHNAVSNDGTPATFDSGNVLVGESFSFTFTEPGTYDYSCTFHSSGNPPTGMVGTITVEAGASPNTAMRGDPSAPTLIRLLSLIGLITVIAGATPFVARRYRRR